MIYIVAKQLRVKGSIAYPFDKSDPDYSSYLADKYCERGIQIIIAGNLGSLDEYNPVTYIQDKSTFETIIDKLIEELESKLLYAEAVKRLEEFEKDQVTYTDEEVRGKRSKVNLYDPDDDEWE